MERKNRQASIVQRGLVAETVYNQGTKKTQFAVYEDGAVRYADSIETEIGETQPLDARSDVVNKSVILLPSEATEYRSDTELLHEVQASVHKRCDVSPEFELIAAHYVLLTWLHDRLNELPYLRVRGDYGSGKSRFLRVVGSMCYRPIFASGATTTSPIFRILDQIHGTLVLDEADFKFSDQTNDLVKILNTGYQKGIPVLRSEGKGVFEVRSYDTYGPKIIATRQNYDDQALESRFLVEDMGRSTLRPDIPIRLDDAFQNEALLMRNKLLMWRFRNYNKPLAFNDDRIEGLQPRLQQIITPLIAIFPSPEIRETLIAHAKRYGADLIADRALSWEAEVTLALLRLRITKEEDELTIKDIAWEVNSEMDEKERLTPKKIGWVLRAKLHLKPRRTNRGFVLSLSRNKEHIEYWKDKLGITDEDVAGEQVNEVNVANMSASIEQIPPLTSADLPF